MGDKDGKITSRLSHLTGLVLDDYSLCQNGMETGSLWSIADGDKREVEWARRLLHRSDVLAYHLLQYIITNKRTTYFNYDRLRMLIRLCLTCSQ